MTIWPCSFNTNPRLMDTAQASKVLLSCLAEKDRALPWLDGGLTILAQMVQILEQAAAAGGGMPPSKDPGRTDSMVQILLQAGIPVGRRVAKGRVGATKANRRMAKAKAKHAMVQRVAARVRGWARVRVCRRGAAPPAVGGLMILSGG